MVDYVAHFMIIWMLCKIAYTLDEILKEIKNDSH